MWGARGPFLPAAAMLVAVVMPIVFCAKGTELKLVGGYQKVYLQQYIVKHIVIHISLIERGPSPSCGVAGARTTLVQWTPAYWVSPESSCHCKND
jgi:hypothetical protein